MPPTKKNPTPAYPSEWANPEELKNQGYKVYQSIRGVSARNVSDYEGGWYTNLEVSAWLSAFAAAGYKATIANFEIVKSVDPGVSVVGFMIAYVFELVE